MTARLAWPRPPHARTAREPHVTQAVMHRLGWAGQRAESIWRDRFDRLARVVLDIEIGLVATGDIGATVVTALRDDLPALFAAAAGRGLVPIPFGARATVWNTDPRGLDLDASSALCDILLVRSDDAPVAVDRLAGDDPAATAAFFGYPPCCARAWCEALAAGMEDPLSRHGTGARRQGVPMGHLVLAGLGLGPLRHVPCAPDCGATTAAKAAFLAAGVRLGHEAAMRWLEEMDDWNVTWSAAGGVAEIKTALFRYTHLTDHGLPVRFEHRGGAEPEGAAPGRVFPFEARPRRGGARQNRHDATAPCVPDLSADEIGTGWEAAGFASAFALRSRFSAVVWDWSVALRGGAGGALHLGCGDGLLLELVVAAGARMTPFGADISADLIARARKRHPGFEHHFQVVDWPRDAAACPSADERGWCIAFLDPEPLVDVSPEIRTNALAGLLARVPTVVLYFSDRARRRFVDLEALAEAAGARMAPECASRISARLVAAK